MDDKILKPTQESTPASEPRLPPRPTSHDEVMAGTVGQAEDDGQVAPKAESPPASGLDIGSELDSSAYVGEFRKHIRKFLPFFEELRRRLYRGVILFVVAFVGGFLSTRILLKKALEFVQIEDVTISATSPFQFIEVSMNVGFFIAIVISVPYFIYGLYKFAFPALNTREKLYLLKIVPLSIGLFIIGFSYGLFILYQALGILAAINVGLGISNFWSISRFLSQMLTTSALLGLIFEFPLLLALIIKLGIISPEKLKNNRKIAYFLSLFAVALLPPTDIISLIAMTLPLVLLYEGTILLSSKKKIIK